MFNELELMLILDGLAKLDPKESLTIEGEYSGTVYDLKEKVLRLINEGGDANNDD
ncbi:hypothetical protein KJK38_00270 [Bacillus velezensis]|uniref:hypothetical protein n=1 Tax=Bacillus velezensis TaxID=492670 RepID=UPI001BDB1150|nr:hypothetical protein [Bacillus velezensis]MBT0952065.1 hypothetical protein [Bacillus velezensis]